MLDIGCGSGVSLLEAELLGAEVFGVEADPNVERLARDLGLKIHQGSIEDHPFAGVTFDLIVMNQVIEHIPEPDKALRLIAGRLSPGGRAVLVFPNRRSLWCRLSGMKWINWHIPYHLHHFDVDTFSRLAQRTGFKVISARTITPNLWTLLQLMASRKQVKRGQPNPLWQVRAADATGSASRHSSFHLLLRRSIVAVVVASFGLMNRWIDLVGRGDCLMVELAKEER
jgi:SAM-dependent methyltransferase